MMATVDLEKELDTIRERRLAMRLHVEKLAQVKGEKADLRSFLKFDVLFKQTRTKLDAMDKAAAVLEQQVNKLRSLCIEMGE